MCKTFVGASPNMLKEVQVCFRRLKSRWNSDWSMRESFTFVELYILSSPSLLPSLPPALSYIIIIGQLCQR